MSEPKKMTDREPPAERNLIHYRELSQEEAEAAGWDRDERERRIIGLPPRPPRNTPKAP